MLVTVASAAFFGKPYRDKALWYDAQAIGSAVPKHTIIGIARDLTYDWALSSYLYRWNYQSVAPGDTSREYWLESLHGTGKPPEGYALLPVDLLHYKLFHRAEAAPRCEQGAGPLVQSAP